LYVVLSDAYLRYCASQASVPFTYTNQVTVLLGNGDKSV